MESYSRKEKLQIDVLDIQEEREHFHQDFELLFLLEGEMEVTVGEYRTKLRPEDILVVNANKKHSLCATQNVLYARLFITYQLISDIFESMDIIFWCDSTKGDNEAYEELRKLLKQLLNHYLSTRGGIANFGHIALCYQVMDFISINFLVRAVDKESVDEGDKFEERIFQINNYIRANYHQPISLKELSEKLYLSNGYLSRFFKKNYGMSFVEYLSNIRLYHAVDELLYTDTSITKIAYDNGFSSVAVFNKSFKNTYGETPSAYRKNSRSEKIQREKAIGSAVIEQRLEQFLREDGLRREQREAFSGLQAEYSVKSDVLTKYPGCDMINIGAAEDLMKSEVREHVILLREALRFQYVRFWNIFSKELLIDITNKDGVYHFSRLDSILDFLLQQGLKPHMELGWKPKRIFSNVQHALINEPAMVKLPDIMSWTRFLDGLMRHLTHQYGGAEVKTWRMEVWMPEENCSREEYFELFQSSYETVHKYCRGLKIGGCGFRMDMLNEEGKDFFKAWSRQRCQPDFLTFTFYAYVRGEINQDNYSKRVTDNERVLHCVQKAREIADLSGFQSKAIWLTEWNLTISDRNYINDTCFKGAYIIKNILDAYEWVEGMAYFLGSDRVSEYYDSNVMLHGGTGILSRDGILKPAGFAFEFLNRLYPFYIGKGENSLITTDRQGTYGIVCHNQKQLNYNYYLSKENEIEKENIWKYFDDREGLELEICLTDVEDGTYQIKVYRINEANGSVLDIWGEMEYEKELERSDIRYFRRICEPKLNILKAEAVNGKLLVKTLLAANEICFIRISYVA